MKAWSAFLPDLLIKVPGCPSVLAQHEVKRAAQDFFKRARCWRSALEPIDVAAGDQEITVAADNNGEAVAEVEQGAIGTDPLDPVVLSDLPLKFGRDWLSQTGEPECVCALTPTTIRLVPYPTSAIANPLSVVVSLMPSDSATGIPDELFYQYREEIVLGARARLLSIPEREWSAIDVAAALMAVFEDKVVAARSRAAGSFMRARKRSRPKWC